MSENVNLRDINQLALIKQHLSDDSKVASKHMVEAAKDICGLHAQVASTPYLSLWNRVEGFQKEDLSRELYEKRTLVKIWGVRATLHIFSAAQVAEYYQATRRVGGRLTLVNLELIHEQILKVLDKEGPLTAQELTVHVPEFENRVQTRYGEMSLGQWSLRQMCQSTVLIPVKPKGDWTSNLHTYANFQKWLPSVDLQLLSEREAKEKITCHYLSGFGPTTADDIAWWVGITKERLNRFWKEWTTR